MTHGELFLFSKSGLATHTMLILSVFFAAAAGRTARVAARPPQARCGSGGMGEGIDAWSLMRTRSGVIVARFGGAMSRTTEVRIPRPFRPIWSGR